MSFLLFRNTLLSTIKSLRYLNEEKQTDSASVPSMAPDGWLAMCLSHVDGYRHLHADYTNSLELVYYSRFLLIGHNLLSYISHGIYLEMTDFFFVAITVTW